MSSTWTHPKCGKTITQKGNRTGHCSACCETFEGQTLFDAHQRVAADGSVVCLKAGSMTFQGARLRLVDGSWRGPALDATKFARAES